MARVEILDLTDPSTVQAARYIHPFLALRRQVFIEDKGWNLDQAEGLEFDIYDTPAAKYLFLLEGDDLVAGARLLRCDTRYGLGRPITYMIQDAFMGLLTGLPTDITFDAPPSTSESWELSRMVSKKSLRHTRDCLVAAGQFIRDRGGRTCISLASPKFKAMGQIVGFDISEIGPMHTDEMGKAYCALASEV